MQAAWHRRGPCCLKPEIDCMYAICSTQGADSRTAFLGDTNRTNVNLMEVSNRIEIDIPKKRYENQPRVSSGCIICQIRNPTILLENKDWYERLQNWFFFPSPGIIWLDEFFSLLWSLVVTTSGWPHWKEIQNASPCSVLRRPPPLPPPPALLCFLPFKCDICRCVCAPSADRCPEGCACWFLISLLPARKRIITARGFRYASLINCWLRERVD